MKANECLQIGIDCGLTTVEEAVVNVEIHCMSLFVYDRVTDEINELISDMKLLVPIGNWSTTKIEEVYYEGM